jgi:hypothetical protein
MKRTLPLLGLVLLMCGCLGVPKSSISGTLGGQPFALTSPKDSTLVGLRVTAGTNGLLSVVVERLEVKMNPDVVSMSGRAQVDLVNAVASGVADAAGKAAAAAVKP